MTTNAATHKHTGHLGVAGRGRLQLFRDLDQLRLQDVGAPVRCPVAWPLAVAALARPPWPANSAVPAAAKQSADPSFTQTALLRSLAASPIAPGSAEQWAGGPQIAQKCGVCGEEARGRARGEGGGTWRRVHGGEAHDGLGHQRGVEQALAKQKAKQTPKRKQHMAPLDCVRPLSWL